MACSRPFMSVKPRIPCMPTRRSIASKPVHHSSRLHTTTSTAIRPRSRYSVPISQPRSASTTAAVAASTNTAQDARSLLTRLKNLLLGTTISLTLILGYYYTTDTRASFHEYLVIPCLRYFYPDAEDAHEFGNRALKALGRFGLQPRERGAPDARGDLAVEVFGHILSNPIGTSAGIDKHCDIPSVLLAAGPAIIEIGGVTPLPQEGNQKPRVWRIPSQKALINRYGLNSEGADHVAMRLRQRVREYAYHMGWGIDQEAEQRILDGEARVPPGSLCEGKLMAVQVAKNKWTPDDDIEAVKNDYVHCVDTLARYADIIIVNVSSPNTAGLRGLQKVEPLTHILTGVVEAARKVKRKTPVNVMVKVSPDEDTEDDVSGICDAIYDSGVDGVVVGNTTKRRPDPLPSGYSLPTGEQRILSEQGGYSGPQTFDRTVALVKRYRRMLDEMSYSRTEDETTPSSYKASTEPEFPKQAKQTIKQEPSAEKEPSIASSVKSLLLETHEETHPPTTPKEIEESVERDRQHLKPETAEAEAESKSQPIIRLPERINPFSSSSSSSSSNPSEESSSSPSSSQKETQNLAASSSTDTLPSPSTSPLSPSSFATPPRHSSDRRPQRRKYIFATGGITNGAQALEVLAAGADVAQVYTALVYGGIGTVSKIKEEMREELGRRKGEGGEGRGGR